MISVATPATTSLEEERLQGDLRLQRLSVSYPGIAQPAVQDVSIADLVGFARRARWPIRFREDDDR